MFCINSIFPVSYPYLRGKGRFIFSVIICISLWPWCAHAGSSNEGLRLPSSPELNWTAKPGNQSAKGFRAFGYSSIKLNDSVLQVNVPTKKLKNSVSAAIDTYLHPREDLATLIGLSPFHETVRSGKNRWGLKFDFINKKTLISAVRVPSRSVLIRVGKILVKDRAQIVDATRWYSGKKITLTFSYRARLLVRTIWVA